jgi:uncharacterized small protein (DUF1192 family)
MTDRNEFEIIRLSKKTRDELDIKPQSLISIKNGNKILRLRIRKAFQEDVETWGSNRAFLNEHNHDILHSGSGKNKITEVTPFIGLTIGCDPEFLFINKRTNDIQIAKALLEKKINSPFGIRISKYGYIGYDGNSSLGELRPDPVTINEGKRLINNIRNLILSIKKGRLINSKDTRVIASSFFNHLPAGFHIHFGLPDIYITGENLLQEKNEKYDFECNITDDERILILPSLVIKSLDYHIGMLIQEIDDLHRERTWKTQYGKAGDFRVHQYTLEYRVPGGMFLKTPRLTKQLLASSSLVVANTLSLIKEITNDYKKKEILNIKKLESNFNKALGIPDTLEVPRILNGEETLSTTEKHSLMTDISKNLEGMAGANATTKDFVAMAFGVQAPPVRHFKDRWEAEADLVEHWSLLDE